MVTLSREAYTLLDWRERVNPDGNIADIIEVLAQSNPILQDMTFMEGNLPTGIVTTQRSSLPQPGIRRINQGVPYTKSTTKQIVDTATMYEARNKIDVKLLALQNDPARFRYSEDLAFVAGFGNRIANDVIYGQTTEDTPDQFNGLDIRLRYLGNTDDPTKEGYTTIDAGGTGTNFTSVYFVNWGERTCSGFFPKNGQAGLKKEDLGQKTVTDPAGNEFEALVTKWNWDVGLTVRDYRAVGALRNIDTAWFSTATSAQKQKLIENVIRVHDRLRDPNAIMYCSRSMYTFFKLCLIDKNNVHVDLVTLENGIKELRVDGLIVRKLDCISEKEAKVTNA